MEDPLSRDRIDQVQQWRSSGDGHNKILREINGDNLAFGFSGFKLCGFDLICKFFGNGIDKFWVLKFFPSEVSVKVNFLFESFTICIG